MKLAEELDGKNRYGWRFVSCGNWEGRGDDPGDIGTGIGEGGERKSLEKTLEMTSSAKGRHSSRKTKGLPGDLKWVKGDLTDSYNSMAPVQDTAQVHPFLFTTTMLSLAQEKGVKFLQGKATSVQITNGRASGVAYSSAYGMEGVLPASQVIVAAGAWSSQLLPALPVSATRAHSVTIHPPVSVTIAPYVLFTEITIPSATRMGTKVVTPEIYARPDNEVYACGPGEDSPLPGTVDEVVVDREACDAIHQHVTSISQELRDGKVDKRQACFLPIVGMGDGPIIGEASQITKGLYIATGHTCWVCISRDLSLNWSDVYAQGICNAPGTAKAIVELVMEGKVSCAKLQKLDPARFL